jgi:hypothetical protein
MWFPSSPSFSSSVGTGFITECIHWKKKREMMGNHIHSVMNPVPSLEEEKGDDGEPHTFSNESSSYTGTGFITECMWFPTISLFFQCRNWIHY